MKFTVYGEPVAKGRPRFSTRGGKVRSYTPEKTASYENLVKLSFDTQVEDKYVIQWLVKANIKAYFKIPSSFSKKKLKQIEDGALYPVKKPDCDNIAKTILDALNGRAYGDDKQVVILQVEKYYSNEPRVEVEILEV
jgi:Holliday junction resolvase RusA-like endonuclease